VIEDCNVSANYSTGIFAYRVTVRHCVVSGNGWDGVAAVGGSLLQNNQLRGNNLTFSPLAADLRLVGSNFVSDSLLGKVRQDNRNENALNSLERNGNCGIYPMGGSFAINDTIPAYPNAEYNLSVCSQ
jgi:hypothetical protein